MFKRGKSVLLAAGLAAVLAGGLAASRTQAAITKVLSPHDVVTTSDAAFLREAAMDNTGEIALARVALNRGDTDSVRWLASKIIRDHKAADSDLRKVARISSVSLPSGMDPMHRSMIARLRHLSGPSFDRAYMGIVQNHHSQMSAHMVKVAGQTRNQALRDFILRVLPPVQDHGQLARDITVQHGGFITAHRRGQ
jgi:putative membrane protein